MHSGQASRVPHKARKFFLSKSKGAMRTELEIMSIYHGSCLNASASASDLRIAK